MVLGLLVTGAVCTQISTALAQKPDPATTSERYQPRLGQSGKDVMWLPSRDDLLARMLESVRLTSDDLLVDLGAGDGKIVIAAARHYGARALGIEYNPQLADLARRLAEQAGVADRVRIVAGDIFKEDFSQATVVTMYLLEELNLQLRPTLLAMKPGTRVVSNTFSMGDWDPDEVIEVQGHTAYRWVVPASVAGEWELRGLPSSQGARLTLHQRFQRIAGQLTIDGHTQPLLGAELVGAEVTFRYLDTQGLLKGVRGQVQGSQFVGQVMGPYGMVEVPVPATEVQGRRLNP